MTIRVTEAEWEVLKALWEHSPRTATDLSDDLATTTAWKIQTVKTLLSRLVSKKAITYEKVGREFHYRPLLDRDRAVREETTSFARRVFDGAMTPMLAKFIESADLTEDDLAELRRVIDRQRGDS